LLGRKERLSAPAAELLSWLIQKPAGRASKGQGFTALSTKAAALAVLSLALRAAHFILHFIYSTAAPRSINNGSEDEGISKTAYSKPGAMSTKPCIPARQIAR